MRSVISLALLPRCFSLALDYKFAHCSNRVELRFLWFMDARWIRRIGVIVVSWVFFLGVVVYVTDVGGSRDSVVSFWLGFAGGGNATITTPYRKLIHCAKAMVEPNRIWGDKCSKSDVVINQGPTAPVPPPRGCVPTYTGDYEHVR